MDREATKVTTLRPSMNGQGMAGEDWVVGEKKQNPDGKWDVVDGIFLTEEWGRVVVISYRNFGTEWLLNHVESIEFKDVEYEEKQKKK